MNFYVYIMTNFINGKQYVGDRKINKYDNRYLGSGRYFKLTLKKYGRENFKKQILEYLVLIFFLGNWKFSLFRDVLFPIFTFNLWINEKTKTLSR